jgi:DNA-binding IclR family transcriptional regulator
MSSVDSNLSSTALRALRVLEIVGEGPQPIAVADVAARLGTDRSTAYRMLMTLLHAGYVRRDDVSNTYQLGYRLLYLTKSLLNDGERSVHIADVLSIVAGRTQETVHFCVLDRNESVLVQRAKGTQLVSVDFQIGDRSQLYCTSIGKVLLAYLDYRQIETIIAEGLPKRAANTITDGKKLRDELLKVRAQGYAYDDREFHDDMRCVAVPVFDKSGVAGGISISGPRSRFTMEKLQVLRIAISEAAHNLSQRLGGRP